MYVWLDNAAPPTHPVSSDIFLFLSLTFVSKAVAGRETHSKLGLTSNSLKGSSFSLLERC